MPPQRSGRADGSRSTAWLKIRVRWRSAPSRDEQDSQRATAPLRAAADAIHVDTDGMSVEEVVERIWAIIQERAVHER